MVTVIAPIFARVVALEARAPTGMNLAVAVGACALVGAATVNLLLARAASLLSRKEAMMPLEPSAVQEKVASIALLEWLATSMVLVTCLAR